METNKKKIFVTACIAVAAVLFIVILAVEGIGSFTRGKTDTSEGVALIEAAESADVTVIETKIQNLEDKEKQEAQAEDTRSIKEKFASTVVVGDSITVGFTEYDVLNASSVVAEIGVQLDGMDTLTDKLKELNPQVVFLSLGMNDIIATKGDTDTFSDQYKDVIDKIKEELPDTKIFVNSIFPVQQQEIEKEPALEKLDDYNEMLRELCDKKQIAFVDNTALVSDDYYEQDGVHFRAAFYPVWAERMAEVAGL